MKYSTKELLGYMVLWMFLGAMCGVVLTLLFLRVVLGIQL